jgi:hypothetical protein
MSLSDALAIVGLAYAIYTTWVIWRGVQSGALKSMRSIIDMLEEDKKTHPINSPAWLTMHHAQRNLEIVFSILNKMFNPFAKKTKPT